MEITHVIRDFFQRHKYVTHSRCDHLLAHHGLIITLKYYIHIQYTTGIYRERESQFALVVKGTRLKQGDKDF